MENTYEVENIKQATGVGSVTLVGYLTKSYPMTGGNCFSVHTDAGEYRVVNFGYENLEELMRREVVAWPLDIIPISERHCVIADHRIPKEWYQDRFCSTCTPSDLLPPQQKLERVLDLKSGRRVEREIEIDGKKMIAVSYNLGMKEGLVMVPFKWSVDPSFPIYEHPNASNDLENEILKSKYADRDINSDFYGRLFPNDEDNAKDKDEQS